MKGIQREGINVPFTDVIQQNGLAIYYSLSQKLRLLSHSASLCCHEDGMNQKEFRIKNHYFYPLATCYLCYLPLKATFPTDKEQVRSVF